MPSPHLPLGLRRGGVGEEACCAPVVVKGAAAASSAACSASFRYGTLPGPLRQPAGAQLLLVVVRVRIGHGGRAQSLERVVDVM